MTPILYFFIGFLFASASLILSRNLKDSWNEDGLVPAEQDRLAIFIVVWGLWPLACVLGFITGLFLVTAGIGKAMIKLSDFVFPPKS